MRSSGNSSGAADSIAYNWLKRIASESTTLFRNRYLALPETLWSRAAPETAPAPSLVAWNTKLANQFDAVVWPQSDADKAAVFSGTELPPDIDPVACAYAGHQFGHLVPQLGDGRAMLLGDAKIADGQYAEIQLKGAGRTAYSRGGDGRSALGPVLREYLLSEAMHALGVPTTRALAAVTTGTDVIRDGIKPGAIMTRVAKSHVRVGSFFFAAIRGDTEAVQALLDFCIERLYPSLVNSDSPVQEFFGAVCEAQAELIAHWMASGFIHGVMNTDNMAISGETLDYGPCAFLDEYDPDKVFSSIDHQGRYAYKQQPAIAQWNLARLAEALLLLDDNQEAFGEQLSDFVQLYKTCYRAHMARRLGLQQAHANDQALIDSWLAELANTGADYHLSFSALVDRVEATDTSRFGEFETRWRARLANDATSTSDIKQRLRNANPWIIARNHQLEAVISAAESGDFQPFERLHAATRSPFEQRPEWADLAAAPTPDQRVRATFCGT